MEVNLTISPSVINLGETVTVTYTSTGADDTQISADNLATPIDLGAGNQSGTIKLLPVISGTFNVSIMGSLFYNGSGPVANKQVSASCQVN
jgi:hypothetical protein